MQFFEKCVLRRSYNLMKVAGLVVLFFLSNAVALDRVVGANATLDIEPGARSAALGSATMAVDGDYLGLVSNPYQLANVDYTWASFSHTAYYEDTKYDFASVAIPFAPGQGLGFALARFGADDIPYIKEGEPLPEGSNYNTLSIADWLLSATWGMRFNDRITLGASFHMLYRDMDQSGWGFRSDLGVRYRAVDQLYLSALLKGWTSSATVWGSGEFEYSSPELYMAASYSVPVKYLYGTFNVFWQSAGFFHDEPRSLDFETDEDVGGCIWESPLDWLSGGHGGMEFNFDFGLSVRLGLSSFTTWKSVTAGAGLMIANFVRVDYAFESHPVLSRVHRVSVTVSPYLFNHVPEKKQGHLTPANAGKKLLTEEPDEMPAESEPATTEENAVEQAPVAGDSLPVVPNETPKAPISETEDEILEPAPSGGMSWEE